MENIGSLYTFLEDKWFSITGLICSEIIAFVFFLQLLVGKESILVSASIIIIVCVAIYLLWWLSRSAPKASKDKIGFLVAIDCSEPSERKKIYEDFIKPLRVLVLNSSNGNSFDFLVLRQHLNEKIVTQNDAEFLRIKAKCHFMIYGTVKLREINKVNSHIFEINGIVAHAAIPGEISKTFSNEFRELLPNQIHVPTENDVVGLRFTSEWAEVTSKYIIATACGLSGDFDYAETLYNEAKSRIYGMDTSFFIYKLLKDKIPIRISELNIARAKTYYSLWDDNKEKTEYLEAAEKCMTDIVKLHQERSDVIILNSIFYFVLHGNIEKSIETLNKVHKQDKGQIWHLNMAFLLGYQGNLRNSARHYRLAVQSLHDYDGLYKIENFIDWVINRNPDVSQLSYCSGYFNEKIKGDVVSAKKDYKKFLSNIENESKYSVEFNLAREFLEKNNKSHGKFV